MITMKATFYKSVIVVQIKMTKCYFTDKVRESEAHTEPEHEADAEPDDEEEQVKPKKIPNQFNFCERAALTYTNPLRVSA